MPTIQEWNQLAATVRRQEDEIRNMAARMDALRSGSGGGFNAPAMPAEPGTIWSFFAKVAWADREYVYPHAMRFEAEIQGTDDGAGNPTDGVPVQPVALPVVADGYFFVAELFAEVEIDPTNPLEAMSPQYVKFQIEDDTRRNATFGRDPLEMTSLAPTQYRQGRPLTFSEYPMAWAPKVNIRTTFYPMAGFPTWGNQCRGMVTTRTARILLNGVIASESLVKRIFAQNEGLMQRLGLTGDATRRR